MKKQYTRIEGNTARRLDRFYISNSFPTGSVATRFFDTPYSDHVFAPTMEINKIKITRWGRGRWMLNESLLTKKNKKEFEVLWKELRKRKVLFSSALDWWDASKKKVKSFFISKGLKKKRESRNKAAQLAEDLNNIHQQHHLSTQQKKNRIQQIKFQLKNISDYKTKGQKIRSKILDFNNESENHTDFFKLEADNATSKQINSLKNGNREVHGKEEVLDAVHNFWYNLWGTRKNIDVERQENFVDNNISSWQQQQPDLSGLSKEKLIEGLKTQNKKGSPGSDGLTPAFYDWAWEIIEEDFIEMINNCYLNGSMPASMREAIVTLIPKKGDKKLLKNWRPVSLLNVDYKILSKVITKRLEEDVKNLISIEQKCAVKGRHISDIHLNILAALKRSNREKKVNYYHLL